jgi:hypothetical protein
MSWELPSAPMRIEKRRRESEIKKQKKKPAENFYVHLTKRALSASGKSKNSLDAFHASSITACGTLCPVTIKNPIFAAAHRSYTKKSNIRFKKIYNDVGEESIFLKRHNFFIFLRIFFKIMIGNIRKCLVNFKDFS